MPRLRALLPALSLLVAAAFALTPAFTQDADTSSQGAKKKAAPKKQPAAAKKPAAEKKPAAKQKSGRESQASVSPSEPTMIGQYGDWGAYAAAPGGTKVCFALSKPKSQKASKDDVKRDPAYMFVATRPTENVRDEISVILGYPLNPRADATAQIGSATYLMFGQNDGVWVKNAAEEPRLVDAMRKGSELIIKSRSSRGTETTDTYSLMGISQALDRVAKECGNSG
jgi:hypothetical protein